MRFLAAALLVIAGAGFFAAANYTAFPAVNRLRFTAAQIESLRMHQEIEYHRARAGEGEMPQAGDFPVLETTESEARRALGLALTQVALGLASIAGAAAMFARDRSGAAKA